MSDLFDQHESTKSAQPAVQQLFVDEAGNPRQEICKGPLGIH